MSDFCDFHLRFWGVRGSIACSREQTSRYGSNTACVEVRCGEHLIIFDAGTGLCNLGNALVSGGLVDTQIYLSHTHLDHICGLPFFKPLYMPQNRVRISAGNLKPEYSLEKVLSKMMAPPLFPVSTDIFQAKLIFRDFIAGESDEPWPGIRIKTAPLNHPDRATGYRLDYKGNTVCYITDTEHREERVDRQLLDLIDGADFFVYDSTYTDEEYQRFKGFGHSTWQEGVRLAEMANVKKLIIFHHDPEHDDDFMDKVAREAEDARPGTLVARESMTLKARLG